MAIDPDFWPGRRVLLTGHTGFKGAWLSLWLQALGADVTGLAPGPPTTPSVYELARVGEHMQEHAVDVRDRAALLEAIRAARPEVVLHLAAQPLVRRSLREPALTYDVNVLGTVNVLEAVRLAPGDTLAVVLVTSDKCYENSGSARRAFVEEDPLGGADPYSSSKACAELVGAAYRSSFFDTPEGTPLRARAGGEDGPLVPSRVRLASARAGNVIGGGDWGEDRLLADAQRAVEAQEVLLVRNPLAVRPWQHVLNPLGGYLSLAQALCGSARHARAFNFGPPATDERTVGAVVERVAELWDGRLRWAQDEREHPHEAAHLALDSTRARTELGWEPAFQLDEALPLIVAWQRAHAQGADMRRVSLEQIERAGG